MVIQKPNQRRERNVNSGLDVSEIVHIIIEIAFRNPIIEKVSSAFR